MKILVAHNVYRIRGGEDVVVERETELLRNAGHEIRSFLVRSGDKAGLKGALEAALYCSYSKSSRDALSEELEKFRPDIVHVHNFFPFLTPSVYDACEEAGVPVVQTLHNFRLFCANGLMLRDSQNCELCLTDSSWNAVRHACYRDSHLATLPVARMIAKHRREGTWQRKVDQFLAITQYAKAKFVEAGLSEVRVAVKANFCPDLLTTHRRREGDYAVYIGRLSREKGISTLLEVWKGLGLPLRILGDGPLTTEVSAHGFLPETGLSQKAVHEILAGAKFLVLPTECFEGGIPLVLLEALSLGVPIISTRFGAAGEVLLEGENALLIPQGNRIALRDAVLRMDRDAELRRRIGLEGRRTYEERFTPEKNLSQLMGIYAKVIESKQVNR